MSSHRGCQGRDNCLGMQANTRAVLLKHVCQNFQEGLLKYQVQTSHPVYLIQYVRGNSGNGSTCQRRRNRRCWLQPLGREDLMEGEMEIAFSPHAWEITQTRVWWATAHGVAESKTWLSAHAGQMSLKMWISNISRGCWCWLSETITIWGLLNSKTIFLDVNSKHNLSSNEVSP